MNSKTKYRIANWNLERPRKGSKRTLLTIEKINEINADIFVLTESSDAINLIPEYSGIKSIPFDKSPKENWVAIWTKWEITTPIQTFDPKRTACGLVNSPFGELIIYGTIIPYHMAGVSGNRYEQTGYKTWQLHEEDILSQSQDWNRIQLLYPDAALVVLGDFNQTRDNLPKGYGTINGREVLSKELERNNLNCLTGIDFSKTGQLTVDPKKGKVRRNIDHICVSINLLSKFENLQVSAWNHFNNDDVYMSDHNGVLIDFEI